MREELGFSFRPLTEITGRVLYAGSTERKNYKEIKKALKNVEKYRGDMDKWTNATLRVVDDYGKLGEEFKMQKDETVLPSIRFKGPFVDDRSLNTERKFQSIYTAPEVQNA